MAFTRRPERLAPQEEAGTRWLLDTLNRLAPERGMPAGTTWEIQLGVRETGGTTRLRLQQTGFQIQAIHTSGRAYSLTCFIGEEDTIEEELRPTVELVLSLWLDRLSTSEPD